MTVDKRFRNKCEPAFTIVRLLGGVRRTAEICGCSGAHVTHWLQAPPKRNGLGGFVPLQHWDPILKYAWVHRLPINKKLLYTGRRRRERVGRMQKRKGDEFERQVVNDIKEAGHPAHRVPLSGSVPGYKGDVKLPTPRGEWMLQLKIHGKHFGGGYVLPINMMRDMDFARVHTDWEDFICMRRSIFCRWLAGEKLWPLNIPILRLQGAVIHRDINRHHALVFRRSDGIKDWYVIFPERLYWDPKPRHRNNVIIQTNEDGTIKWANSDPKKREKMIAELKKRTKAYKLAHGLEV